MIALITGAIGLLGILATWFFNPARMKQAAHDKLVAQLASITKELNNAYRRRDEALTKGDNDALTLELDIIIRLRKAQADLL